MLCVTLAGGTVSVAAEPVKRTLVWDTKELFKKPNVCATEERPAKGMRSFFYEGADFKGKPTWVFAYGRATQTGPV